VVGLYRTSRREICKLILWSRPTDIVYSAFSHGPVGCAPFMQIPIDVQSGSPSTVVNYPPLGSSTCFVFGGPGFEYLPNIGFNAW